jgi:choline kinase
MFLKGKQFILINGDILYDKQVLIDVFNSDYENLSVIDTQRPLPEDGMKVLVENGSNKIKAFSKTFYEGYGCTVGIHKFSEKGSTQFFDKIYEQLQAGINSFHHSAIDNLVKSSDYEHYAMDMNGYKWCEVDDLNDLEIAKEFYNE